MTDSTPILRIISGDDNINLVNRSGAVYASWNPAIAVDKSVYSNSPMANERRLVYRKRDSVIERMTISISRATQDKVIEDLRRIKTAFEEVRRYWTLPLSANISPVYIKAKASCETNARYALILDARIDRHASPYEQPFFGSSGAVLNDVTLLIERGQWMDVPPGQTASADFVYSTGAGFADYLAYDAAAERVTCGAGSEMVDTTNGMTVEGWFRFQDSYSPGSGYIGMLDVSSVGNNWFLAISASSGGTPVITGVAYGATDTFSQSYLSDPLAPASPSLLLDGLWHHVAMAISPLTPSSGPTIALFIDGAELDYITQQEGSTYSSDNAVALRIGNVSSDDNAWPGDITWARVSNAVRYFSPSFSNIPSYCEPPAVDAFTVAQWNIDEGSGGTVDNEQGDATYDGTITNATWSFEPGCYSLGEENIGNVAAVAGFDANVAISDVYVFNASGPDFSANRIGIATPYLLFPTSPVSGDITYFGNANSNALGPFTSLVFDLGSSIILAQATVTWEYWDSAAWSSLSAVDGTNGFSSPEVTSVSWELPGDWESGNLNTILGSGPSVTGWWVRARLSGPNPLDDIYQYNRDVYTARTSSIELSSDFVTGDIGSKIILQLAQQNGKYDRVLAGSKITDETDQFAAFVHATQSDHSHSGITISYDTGSAVATSLWPTTERWSFVNAAEGDATVTITLDSSIASSYAGRYRMLVVYGATAMGSSSDVTAITGSYLINDVATEITAGSIINTEAFSTTSAIHVTANIGVVNISEDPDDIDQLIFKVKFDASGGSGYTGYMYALILIPTGGEFFADVYNPVAGTDGKHVGVTVAGAANNLGDVLVIDDVTNPRKGLYARVEDVGGTTQGNYVVSTPTGVTVKSAANKLWLAFYNSEQYVVPAVGDSSEAGPHMLSLVTVSGAQLYSIMRGSS